MRSFKLFLGSLFVLLTLSVATIAFLAYTTTDTAHWLYQVREILLLILLSGIFILIASTFMVTRHHFNKLTSTEQKLKKANELFFRIFYDSPIAMVLSQPDTGIIIDCNQRFTELLGHERDLIIGKTTSDLGIGGDPATIEMELRANSKAPVWVSHSRQQIHLKERECVLTALVDITARKQAEADIRKSLEREKELSKLKSNFVTMASHEFRTPLTTILSSANLLENYNSGENRDKIEKHLIRIKGAVSSLNTILHEFLSLTRIEEGEVRLRPETVEVEPFIQTIVSNVRAMARSNQLISCVHNGTSHIQVDPAVLAPVVTNLLSNAIKYSPEYADIAVWSEARSTLVIRVADSGIGIPVEDQPHLFDRFFRASNAANIPGTGLGLHIARHHVELMNGSIGFVSAPGHGSTFTVTIPLMAVAS